MRLEEWQRLVEAARSEGVVNYFAGTTHRLAFIEPFERAFPGIKIEGVYAPPGDLVPRILTERQAGRFIHDVYSSGTNSMIDSLKPAGALAPLRPTLVHPEVVDNSAWFDGHLWWADSAEPYTALMFQGSVQSSITYHTQLVDPRQFTSYRDLLDPRWVGKIVATDVRIVGAGAVPVRYIHAHPELGPAFLERLFSEMDLTLSRDQRQIVDWVAQGRYPLALWANNADVTRAKEQGLPLAQVPGEQMREGAPLGPSGGAIALFDRPPHPNAAKLFVNWVLSREGQIAWQQSSKANSLRVDIPKDEVDPIEIPKAGVKYANGAAEEISGIPAEVIGEIVESGLQKARR